jgi:hypothetical protein
MIDEKAPQVKKVEEKISGVSIPEHKDGWMSANAIAKGLESGLGDNIVWENSNEKGVPSTRRKFQAIVSVHAIRFLAQKYLKSDPTLAEIQRNKTQVKEQYAPELVRALYKDIRKLRGTDGYLPEYRVAKMLGLTQAQLQDEIRYWVYQEGQVKVAKEFNRVFLCFDPKLVETLGKK